MSSEKQKLVAYMTAEDKQRVEERARTVNRNMSDYVSELVMWDAQLNLVERARRGELAKQRE